MFAAPAVTPVTTPVEASTVATAVLSEDQEPPAVPVELAVEVSPMLTLEDVNETDPASQAMVNSIVFEKLCPLHSGVVYVIVTVPAETPVTTPVDASTVATEASPVVNEPPVVPSVETVEVSATAKVVDVALNVPAVDSVIVNTTSSVIEQDKSSVSVNV